MTAQVLCYGEIGVDNIIQLPFLPSPELASFPTNDTYHIGGAAANTAVWLANFGVETALAGNWIGGDLYGQKLWHWLNDHPLLDLTLVERSDTEATPFCRALVTPDGERSFLIFGYPQARKTELVSDSLAGVRYLALDLYGGEERLRAAELASQMGVQTAVGDVIEVDHPILPLAPIVTNSAAYMRQTMPGIDVQEQTRRLQAVNQGIVIATDGGKDVFTVGAGGRAFHVRPPSVSVLDATGAGDAFRAGLLAGLLQGEPLPRAVCIAVAAGALKVGRLGAATDLPPVEAIISLANTLTVEDANS